MKGIIFECLQNGSVKIKVEGKDLEYMVSKQVLEKGNVHDPKIGQEIIFQEGKQHGNQIKVSKILTEDISSREELFDKVSLPERPSNLYLENKPFNNPYNFVSVVKVPNGKTDQFRKPFVPHDKFEGISGVITCRLKTLTPFFTAATHQEDNKNEHKELDFFSINGKENKWRMPTISGSSLRGVIRSVCEAVSNSSFTALSSEILDYRLLPIQSNKLKCGIVVENAEKNKNGKVKILELAILPFDQIYTSNASQPSLKPNDLEVGWVKIKKDKNNRNIVTKLETSDPKDSNYNRGYFKLTGRNVLLEKLNPEEINKKDNERFFFEPNQEEFKEFTFDEAEKYNELIKFQNEEAKKQNEAIKQNLKSKNLNPNEEADYLATKDICNRSNVPLKKGHLVYFQLNGNIAKNLGYVSIPRWKYEKAIHEKIDKSFHPVEDADDLCPTSRIFGFVRDKKISKKKDNKGKSSYAGRVYFSDAKFDTSNGKKIKYDEKIVLDILGSPKPTTYEFYLYNTNNKSSVGSKHNPNDYNNQSTRLRGRKFYFHQENNGQYRRKNNDPTPQNSTLKRVLTEDNEFIFKVHFENLEDYELGLLLWSLALENGMAHKIGMGKPLGLGSASIEIESMEITDRIVRYNELFNDSGSFQKGMSEISDWKNEYVAKFTEWIKGVFGIEFQDLENVKDIREILKYPNKSTNPTHYPLCKNKDEKQFEWFVANRDSRNKYQILPFPNQTNGVADYLERNEKPRHR